MSGDAICSLWEVGDTYKSHYNKALKQQGKLNTNLSRTTNRRWIANVKI